MGWAAKGIGLKIGKMLEQKAEVIEMRNFLDKVYNVSGKPEELESLTDHEVINLAKNVNINTASSASIGYVKTILKNIIIIVIVNKVVFILISIAVLDQNVKYFI